MPTRKTFALIAVVALWATGVAGAFGALARYASTPGAAHAPEAGATAFLASQRQPGRPLLVMVVHPRCPCTEASLAEMGDLLGRSHGAVDALVLQYQAAGWPQPPPAIDLGGIHIRIVPDPEGKVAATLGAETSGHCIFVDAAGTIRFHGGLTVSRGHRGRSPAQDAILAVVAGSKASLVSAPVFGCSLLACKAPSAL
jgi:hypothetical protein